MGLFTDTHKREMARQEKECADQRARFDGATFSADHDLNRLNTQLAKVYRMLMSGHWYTLGELQNCVGGSEAGISARLRDLRKPKWGANVVERRRRGDASAGLWEYRLKTGDR